MKKQKICLPALGLCALLMMGNLIQASPASTGSIVSTLADEKPDQLMGFFIVDTKWIRPVKGNPLPPRSKINEANAILALYGQ